MEEEGTEMYGISWHDSTWIPSLCPTNIMDYFARSKFYDRTCNNEVCKMQRQSLEHLVNMTGIEYKLVHVQTPILYVIRKLYRHSPEQVTPISQYYVVAGIVYQAPDLAAVVNSRLLNTIFNLNTAFSKALSGARFHPSKGYWWDFHDDKTAADAEDSSDAKKEQASWFQRQRVDLLLGELSRQYPMKVNQAAVALLGHAGDQKPVDIKTEPESKSVPTKSEKRPLGEPDRGPSQAKLQKVKVESLS